MGGERVEVRCVGEGGREEVVWVVESGVVGGVGGNGVCWGGGEVGWLGREMRGEDGREGWVE